MKRFALFALALAVVVAAGANHFFVNGIVYENLLAPGLIQLEHPVPDTSITSRFKQELDREWLAFKRRFRKVYTHAAHEAERRLVWQENLAKIAVHNTEYARGVHKFYLAMNHLGDMTTTEVKSKLNGYRSDMAARRPPQYAHHHLRLLANAVKSNTLPAAVDWRNVSNVVTRVKNQSMCGSCWAFSATGSLEGQHAMKNNGSLVELSEQNLVDCSKAEGNAGCNGGLMDQAFDYVRIAGGLDTETSYPYRGIWSLHHCKFNNKNVGATVRNYTDIPSGNEAALTAAIATVGPISVAIDASDFMFQFYFGGVFHSKTCSTTMLDHGVLVVGYGSDSAGGGDYYIVKNSWGAWWGKKGYIYMSRNMGNNCGIATNASYPIVQTKNSFNFFNPRKS